MTEQHKQLEVTKDFYFVMQPVVKISDKQEDEIVFYEILLRSKKTRQFPGEIFFDLIKSQSGNQMVLSFFEKQLKDILQENPCTKFSVNFEIIQFKSPQTQEFFERMQTWAPNIIVELTERSYATKDSEYLLDAVKKIKKMGYRIFVDDIGKGRNTLSHVQDNVNLVDGIKFAWAHFKSESSQNSVSFLKEWDTLAKKNNLAFVFEGVENVDTQILLKKMGIVYQQGWFFGKPREDMIEAQKC
ncbi:EAL domain-containing protein [Leuconostoc mesenteroides]